MTRHATPLILSAALSLTLFGCGEAEGDNNEDNNHNNHDHSATKEYSITFAAAVGDAAFACDQTFEGLGRNGGVSWTPSDLRMYIHDVELIDADGAPHSLTLDTTAWQTDDVALLDFEDATGSCSNGTPQLNATITGTGHDVTFTSVRFTLGVPESLNHADQALAASPLNVTGLWWSWQGGYKFLKVDGAVPDGDATTPRLFHLGSTMCEPEGDSHACSNANRPTIDVDAVAGDVITFDVATLFDGAHLDADEGGAPGCMSGPDDPDCAPLFGNLGISGSDAKPVFSVR